MDFSPIHALERLIDRLGTARSGDPHPSPARAMKIAAAPLRQDENPTITLLSNVRDAFLPLENQSGHFQEDMRTAGRIMKKALEDLEKAPFTRESDKKIRTAISALLMPKAERLEEYVEPEKGPPQVFTLYAQEIRALSGAMPAIKTARDYYAAAADPGIGRIGPKAASVEDAEGAARRLSSLLTLGEIFGPQIRRPAIANPKSVPGVYLRPV